MSEEEPPPCAPPGELCGRVGRVQRAGQRVRAVALLKLERAGRCGRSAFADDNSPGCAKRRSGPPRRRACRYERAGRPRITSPLSTPIRSESVVAERAVRRLRVASAALTARTAWSSCRGARLRRSRARRRRGLSRPCRRPPRSRPRPSSWRRSKNAAAFSGSSSASSVVARAAKKTVTRLRSTGMRRRSGTPTRPPAAGRARRPG